MAWCACRSGVIPMKPSSPFLSSSSSSSVSSSFLPLSSSSLTLFLSSHSGTLCKEKHTHTHTLSRRGPAVFWHLYHEPALAACYPVQTCGSYHRSKLVQSSSHVQITFNMSDKTHHGSFLKPTADQWLEEHTLYNVIIHWGYLRPLSSEANCNKLECLFFCFFYQWTAF